MVKTKNNRRRQFLSSLMCVMMLSLSFLGTPVEASAGVRPAAPASTFVVNSTADLPDADQGDNLCAAANGSCTLRAAIMQANFLPGADTINIPAGVYTLTRPGDEDQAILGDLDIINDLTIQGAGSAKTIIDGNGAVTNDRVFQILASAKNTSLSGLTIRNGKRSDVFGEGGGLAWEGGESSQILLNDVVFDSNSAKYGGGLSLNYAQGGSVELDNVVLRSNSSASGAGAGLSAVFSTNFSAFLMKGGKVYNNTGANQGGGIELEGTQDGLSTESIQNVEIYGNKANFGAGIDNFGGARPYHIDLVDSYVHDNQAVSMGGGINNFGVINLTRTTLSSNSGGTYGGGLYTQNQFSGPQVQAIFDQSTISGNSAQYGGGVYSDSTGSNGVLTTLTDSTLSGNTATGNGAGFYAKNGVAGFYNATIAANRLTIATGDPPPSTGAGLYILNPAFVTAENTLIAYNTHIFGVNLPAADDCSGPLRSLDNNLIQTLLHCLVSGEQAFNIYGMDPLLGPLGPNGGPTFSQLPSAQSPAIDAGMSPSCTGTDGQPLLIDQRGYPRVVGARCDIGAVERGPMLYLPAIHK